MYTFIEMMTSESFYYLSHKIATLLPGCLQSHWSDDFNPVQSSLVIVESLVALVERVGYLQESCSLYFYLQEFLSGLLWLPLN